MPGAFESLPLISLVFPFQLIMNEQLSLIKMLTLAANKEETKLGLEYPKEIVKPVMEKFHQLIANILCRKNMSMLIIVSPIIGKVYYFSPSKELSNYYKVS